MAQCATTAPQRSRRRCASELDGTVGHLTFVPVEGDLLRAAGEIGHAMLHTLDAIRLASALTIVTELEAAVTYDARQAEAFALGGLAAETPGET